MISALFPQPTGLGRRSQTTEGLMPFSYTKWLEVRE
jgi:hypothetical protein